MVDEADAVMRPMRVAYLVTRYPALSHTFIEKEVADLRALGVEVHTFSVRSSGMPGHPEHSSTTALLGGGWASLRPVVRSLTSSPSALLRGLRTATANAVRRGGSPRSFLWQLFYLAEAALLRAQMEERRIGHLHVHFANNAADVAMLVVALRHGDDGAASSWSISVHGPTDFEEAHRNDLTEKVASAAFVACISDFCRSQVMRHSAVEHWAKLAVVRMTVNSTALEAPPVSAPRAGAPLRVLFVGRLVRQKAPLVLLEALSLLAADAGNVDVVVIGDGPLRAELGKRAQDLPAHVSIKFLGGQPQAAVLDWYRWADIFVLPSFAEGLPVVLMEAMGSGLAVVSTPIAAIPELVEHGRTGLLVTPGRPQALASAIGRLHADPPFRLALGARGREFVRRHYSGDVQARHLHELLSLCPSASSVSSHEPTHERTTP